MPPRRYQIQSRIIKRSRAAQRNYGRYRAASYPRRRYYRRSAGYLSRAASALGSAARGVGRMAYSGAAAALNNPFTRAGAVELGRRAAGAAAPVVGPMALNAAINGLEYLVGHGDYTVKSNSLMGLGSSASDSLPTFMPTKNGVRIVHREFLSNVVSSDTAKAFSVQKFPVQPGYSFPWLSSVAAAFQQYKIHGMVFSYKTMSSDALNSSDTALGTVLMSTQYSVTQPDVISPQQMFQLDFTSCTKPSLSVLHPIECAQSQSKFLMLDVRNGPTPSFSTDDLRLYDFANFYIATYGCPGNSTLLGQLWVSYDISFYKCILPPTADVGDHYKLPDTISDTKYFGAVIPSPSVDSDLGSTLSYPGDGSGVITIPSYYIGNVLVIWVVYGTVSTASAAPPSLSGYQGCSPLNLFAGGGNYIFNAGTSSANLISISTWKVLNGGIIVLNGGEGTFPAANNGGDLVVLAWPTTLIS